MRQENGTSPREAEAGLPDARLLAEEVEQACGHSPRYRVDFELVTELGESLVGEKARSRLEERGPNPVVNCVLGPTEGGYRLIYERIASGMRYGEPWPLPAASVVELDPELRVVCRRDYGGFISE